MLKPTYSTFQESGKSAETHIKEEERLNGQMMSEVSCLEKRRKANQDLKFTPYANKTPGR